MPIQSHRGLETFAVMQPGFAVETVPVSPSLYADLVRDFAGFADHALVAVHDFSSAWTHWERHPAGDEIVFLLSGSARMRIRIDGQDEEVELAEPGDYLVVPRGAWHTATTSTGARMLFITPGAGTENTADPGAD